MLINRIVADPQVVTLLNCLDPGVPKLWSCCFPDGGYGQKPFWYTLPGASNVVVHPIPPNLIKFEWFSIPPSAGKSLEVAYVFQFKKGNDGIPH